MRSRRVAVASVIAGAALLVSAAPAIATWSAAASGVSAVRAGALATAPTPSAAASGASVTVSWTAVPPPKAGVAIRYQVTRINTVTSATTPATGGCAGTLATTSCVEGSVPTGRWAYTIRVVVGAWSGASGSQSATVAVDATPPTVSAAAIQKAAGGTAGLIHQGGTYRAYANATDTGDPATGVSAVTADLSALTTGATATAMTAGSFTVDGVTYGYRSAQLTANNPLSAGVKTFTVTAVDGATNSSGAVAFSATVENTAPAGTDVQTANGGATVGRAEAGDLLTLTFSETIDPNSILAGWNGAATTVTVHIANNPTGDRLTIRDAANAASLPLGTIHLTDTGYVTTNTDFTSSTMVRVGNAIRFTLGTPSGAVGTVTTAWPMTWTPSATATDSAGNACSTVIVTETGGADVEF
jgi:hypothetical protein